MSVRESFVAQFGEANADALREACLKHHVDTQLPITDLLNLFGVIGTGQPQGNAESNMGSDPFKYYVLAAIANDCVSRPSFRKHHGIDLDPMEFYEWVVQRAELDSHDGDYPDQMSVMIVRLDDELNSMADLLLRSIHEHKGETV